MPKKMKRYKQARYKAHRKPINKIVLTAIISSVIILGASIALGAYLGSISAPDLDSGISEPEPSAKPYDAYPKLQAPSVTAGALHKLAYINDNAAEEALMRASGELTGALSIDLLLPSGAPSYKSEVYSRIYSAEPLGLDLSSFIDKAERSGIYIAAIFRMQSLSEDNGDIRASRKSFELSLICEAYSAGVREITLTDASSAQPDELYGFVKSVKEKCPELAVGILLDADTAKADSLLCATLDDIFDFLVLDHTAAFELDIKAFDTPSTEEGEGENITEDKDEDKDEDNAETPQEPAAPEKSELESSLDSTLVLCQRFGARVYIDIGDGCESCLEHAKNGLVKSGVGNYMLALSEPVHELDTEVTE